MSEITGTDYNTRLKQRLRFPVPNNPFSGLEEEAALRIEELEAELDKANAKNTGLIESNNKFDDELGALMSQLDVLQAAYAELLTAAQVVLAGGMFGGAKETLLRAEAVIVAAAEAAQKEKK